MLFVISGEYEGMGKLDLIVPATTFGGGSWWAMGCHRFSYHTKNLNAKEPMSVTEGDDKYLQQSKKHRRIVDLRWWAMGGPLLLFTVVWYGIDLGMQANMAGKHVSSAYETNK